MISEYDWLVVGLGNPGLEFRRTRHNVGFMAVDKIAKLWDISLKSKRGLPLRAGRVNMDSGREVLLVKPYTFMNRCGPALKALMEHSRLKPSRLIVIHDDLDLPLGRLRIKRRGGDGGHRGIRSIIEELGHGRFLRLRLGIGRPEENEDPRDYVLQTIPVEHRTMIERMIMECPDIVTSMIENGVSEAMNKFHRTI